MGFCGTDTDLIPAIFQSLNGDEVSFVLGVLDNELIAVLYLKVVGLGWVLTVTD
jgi:hypothetical protein